MMRARSGKRPISKRREFEPMYERYIKRALDVVLSAVGLVALSPLLALIALLAGVCCKTVPTGYTGILTTFGRVEDSNLDAGFHLKAPWQKIVLMDNRVQKATVDTQAFSSDIQQVDVRMTIAYTINKSAAAQLYEKVGTRYYDNIIYPQLLENTKTVFANAPVHFGCIDHEHYRMRTSGPIGCDNDAVLREVGYTEEELVALRGAGAIG